MMWRKHKHLYDLTEVHQYISDLDRLTLLRDKARDSDEHKRYSHILEIMQLVLAEIQKQPEKLK